MEAQITHRLSYTSMLLPWLSLIIFIGIGFGGYLVPPEGGTTAQAILMFFNDSLVFVFLLAGLFAALLTTADTFLIAAVQTVLVDWRFAKPLKQAGYQPERLPVVTQKAMVKEARIGIIVLGVGAIFFGYAFLAAIPSLIDLLFVIFGLQTALAPSVVYGLFGSPHPSDAKAGIASLVVGGITALVCLLCAMGGIKVLDVTLALWSPIAVLAASTFTFFALRDKSSVPLRIPQ